MRLMLLASDLSAALASATAAAGKARLVRLAAHESGAVITGSDATMSVSIKVPATVEAMGEIAVAADRLAGIADHADGDLHISSTDINVSIAAGDGRYRLPILPDPSAALVLDEEEASITISAQDCRRLFEPLAAANRESSRYYLNGVLWLSGPDGLASVATDGAKLLRTTIAAPSFTTDRRLIIPSKSVAAIEKLIRRESGMLALRRNRRLLSIVGSGFTATTKLIEFTYPDLTSVLPAASDNAAVVRRQDLADSVARLMAAMDGEAPLLAIEWHEPGPVLLYLARQPENTDLADAETKGDAQIAVAPAQLATLLGEFSSAQLRLEITNGIAIHADGKLGVVASMQWNFTTPRTPLGASVRANTGADKQKENSNAHV
ncbi:DNA polymerase III subunit beta [Bradyrhizobium sp. SZCCHNRI2010]|uniref:DNA polymerase III subunit beta n=1 Tax=Bradyrhizobium sp. SZCCHNRI2010 TaxID=3057283 RepID=UPI0028E3286E|nr:DNA polymerase III subunit beta [Bradyrhizobium sp. SZCCHNRI2010]